MTQSFPLSKKFPKTTVKYIPMEKDNSSVEKAFIIGMVLIIITVISINIISNFL